MNKDILKQFFSKHAEKQRKHQEERDAVQGTDMVFVIPPYEQMTLDKWYSKHSRRCKLQHRALTYCFTNTGIGQAIEVRCTCGESINITDYEQW